MAQSKKLTVPTLSKVGAKRLAELLLELSGGDQLITRSLKLEITALEGTAELARAVRKRLSTIKRSRSGVDWNRAPALERDLNLHLEAIKTNVASQDPALAVDLLWEFLKTATPVLDRILGRVNNFVHIYAECVRILGEVSSCVDSDPSTEIDHVFECLSDNGYGQFDELILRIAPTLSVEGQNDLKKALHKQLQESTFANEVDSHRLDVREVKSALVDLADVQEDVDAFIQLVEENHRTIPRMAVKIAERLQKANRPAEALEFLEASRDEKLAPWWYDAYIGVLDELERTSDAQVARWECFRTNLSQTHLRDYLKRLDEVDAFDAEERALDHVEKHEQALSSMTFLIDWREYRRTANLVINRIQEFDGFDYQRITRAAELLASPQPLASTVLLRSMIDFALDSGNTRRYKHAARHLSDCEQLAKRITDYRGLNSHESYVRSLIKNHGRKTSFWGHFDTHS